MFVVIGSEKKKNTSEELHHLSAACLEGGPHFKA